MPDDLLSLQAVRDAAAALERVALSLGTVTEAELDGRRPGAIDYPGETAPDWLTFHAWIAARALGAERPRASRALRDVKLDAATDRPRVVTLTSGATVTVQPKSARALFVMRALDAELRAVGPEVAAVLAGEEPTSEAVHAAVWGPILQSRLLQVWLWIATESIDLPFAEDAKDVEPPVALQSLRPQDVLAIVEAHVQVNQLDLEILVHQFPTASADGPARELADVLGALAHERGVPTATLMCAASVRSLYQQALAAALLAADAKRRSGRDA